MSHMSDLLAEYRSHLELPWGDAVAHRQRVWMVVYPPEQERRLRIRLGEFELATKKSGHGWSLLDLEGVFEAWLSDHKYREQYLNDPTLLVPAMERFANHLVKLLTAKLGEVTENDVVAVAGVSSLFGLGSAVRVSGLVDAVQSAIKGRLLVFFPGRVDGNNFRLLDARDGWNYLAVVISANGGRS